MTSVQPVRLDIPYQEHRYTQPPPQWMDVNSRKSSALRVALSYLTTDNIDQICVLILKGKSADLKYILTDRLFILLFYLTLVHNVSFCDRFLSVRLLTLCYAYSSSKTTNDIVKKLHTSIGPGLEMVLN